MKRGVVPAWQPPPGSALAGGPRPGQVAVSQEQYGEQVMDPISESDSGCRGKMSDGSRCRAGTAVLCEEHLHL